MDIIFLGRIEIAYGVKPAVLLFCCGSIIS